MEMVVHHFPNCLQDTGCEAGSPARGNDIWMLTSFLKRETDGFLAGSGDEVFGDALGENG